MYNAKPRFITLALVIPLLFSPVVSAKSSVWKISKGDDYFYLGGTFHLLSPEDHPLPDEFLEAYEDAREIILETDLTASNTPEFQQKMMASMMYSDERTLVSELNEENYSRLKTFMDQRQISIEQFTKFQPWGVSLIIAVQEYFSLGMVPEYGVDTYVGQLATQDNKTIQSLETPEQQIASLESMGNIDPNRSIEYTLRDLNRLPDIIDGLKEGWRNGDLSMIENNPSVIEMKEEFPEVYRVLLTTRNNNWMKKLVTLFDDNAIEIVLVGAMHLAGNHGLIEQLVRAGFQVDQLE